jgi:hypothetical protein
MTGLGLKASLVLKQGVEVVAKQRLSDAIISAAFKPMRRPSSTLYVLIGE